MDGFLNINKPVGMSSFDVIRVLRRKLGKVKMGHTGTLDPLASGVLPIAVGKATKQIPSLPKEKEYIAEIILGTQTTTDDQEGEVIRDEDASKITQQEIEDSINKSFLGKIMQKPPFFSAIHYKGERLYKLARAGKAPASEEIKDREVEIYDFKILDFHKDGNKVIIKCCIQCSGGTYIRSIARDLGEKLSVGGTLLSLVRTLSGGFRIKESVKVDEVLFDKIIQI